MPPAITVEASRARESVLRAMLWVLPSGAVVLLPSLALLFHLFQGGRPWPRGPV